MRRVATVWLVVGTLIVSACGGGGDDEETAPTTAAPREMTSKEVFDAARPSTVALFAKQGEEDVGGTGVIFDAAKGLVLTNSHVVSGTAALRARVNDQTEVPARILATAPCEDVAVVQLTTVPPGLKAIPFGNSGAVQNQDEVVALGYPASFANPAEQKLVSTSGTVQSPNVAAEPDPSLPRFASAIQHSATINPGNSGGPLLNTRAELIGLNTLRNIGSRQQPIQGQFYAIAIDHIKPLLPDLIAGRSQADPGWSIAPFSQVPLADVFEATGYGTRSEGVQADQLLAANDIDGLFVFGANPDSPADDANIELGDLIERINDVPVTSVKDVCAILQSASPGQTLEVRGRYLTNEGPEQDFGDPWRTELTL
jgi:S1-C subfamily serine protease